MTHTSNVEWRKVLENFRSAYQSLYPSEILIIELVANSLDAGATRISLAVTQESRNLRFLVVDDGKGMQSQDEFDGYHDLGSLTKTRGGTIGWAGIGAKLFLDLCEHVYTETSSPAFKSASSWYFRKGEKAPQWDEVESRGLVASKTGTAVEVVIAGNQHRQFFSTEALQNLLLENYNFALKPYGQAHITVDGGSLEPVDLTGISTDRSPVDLKLKTGERVQGKFFLLREPAPLGFDLVSIVVHGKTIGEQADFKQLARIKDIDRVAGYVRCDALVQIVTTSKDSFNRKNPLWSEFSKTVGAAFSQWLEKNGALLKVERESDFEQLAAELAKDLNKVFSLPDIRALGLDLFQILGPRRTTVQTPDGVERGTLAQGAQPTSGTLGGATEGLGVLTEGDEPGQGVRTDANGDIRASEKTRRTRGGVRIAYSTQPDRPERAWIDPGLRAVLINRAHPAFQCADGLGAIPYYTAECCFDVVTEHIESVEDREQLVRKLFQAFLQVAG